MKYFLLSVLLITISSYAQNKRLILGKEHAQDRLTKALANEQVDNLIDNKTLILKDSTSAVKIAETVLFDIYGKQNIIEEKPYEIYLLQKYWVISGTLPENYLGGTFLIIIDATNCKIIKVIHSK